MNTMTTTNNFAPNLPQQQPPAAANTYGLPDPWEVEAWALPYFPEFGGAGASPPKAAGAAHAPVTSEEAMYLSQLSGMVGQEPSVPVASARVPVTTEDSGYLSRLPGVGGHGVSAPQTATSYNPVVGDDAGYLSRYPGVAGSAPGVNSASYGNDSAYPDANSVSRGSNSAYPDANSVSRGNDSASPSVNPAPRGNNDTGYSPVVVPATGTSGPSGFDVNKVRADFPILNEKVNGGQPLIWLDNGATTQKPRQVIDRISYYYEHENSNIHRAAHELAARSTDAYENARQITANFLGAPSKENIVFVRGTTEGINLVAQAYVKPLLSAGDEIILTILEHHANIVPWQLIAQETGAVIKVAPVDDSGQIILSEYGRLFTRRTKFVSATHVSNALGTVTPVHEMVQMAHCCGVRILIDGAQSVAHAPVNMGELDADFFVMSGHKIFAPTGIGAVYGKSDALEEAKPYQGGGNMIKDVTFERTVYNPPPNKFEAGTGNIADAIGLGAALDYVSKVGIANISAYEHELLDYATGKLSRINGLRLIGTAAEKASVLSFVMDNVSVQQVGKHLSDRGIAVRAGHHCAQPILRRFGLEATVRPTLAFYNTAEEVDKLASAISELAK